VLCGTMLEPSPLSEGLGGPSREEKREDKKKAQ
jgi:hypothetical protein